ncbi:MAG TPA: flagellar basal body-associated FliL family protein [Alphaproteobacteria bacterium]|nr:flagellar basal body-associated FliL family protein [Alphaproteobacteria bacterium]USO06637.1 MAG: flagellar basal body-associated FliL family protein [Rhodospirillales bacterium]HOO82090.1 flagellar basal body-associated FliL family protein [Alphaproteobacteria bacterium]
MADDETDANEEAEDVNLLGEDGEDSEEGNKPIVLIALAGVVVLLLGAGAGLYFTGMLDSVLGKSEPCVEEVDDHGEVIKECPEEDAHGDEHAAKDDGHGGGHGGAGGNFIEIPTMLVNLSSNDGTPRYLRLTVQLELNSSADYAAVEAVIPRVVDQFQTYLRELRVKDLRGSAGIYRLQMELLWRVNQAAAPVKVKDVLFQEILIQ